MKALGQCGRVYTHIPLAQFFCSTNVILYFLLPFVIMSDDYKRENIEIVVASVTHALNSNYSVFLVQFSAAGINQTPLECQAQCLGQWVGTEVSIQCLCLKSLRWGGGAGGRDRDTKWVWGCLSLLEPN